jgi:small subunit ribosomal protein S20
VVNNRIRRQLKDAVKKARQKPTKKILSEAFRVLDRAAKKRVIHPNKAARLKSRLSKPAQKKQS